MIDIKIVSISNEILKLAEDYVNAIRKFTPSFKYLTVEEGMREFGSILNKIIKKSNKSLKLINESE